MQALPIAITGTAALGIGFGLGSFFPGEIGGDGAPSAEVEVKAVTFEGGPARTSTDRDSAAAFRQQFGIYFHTSYAAAKGRLEELFEVLGHQRELGSLISGDLSGARMIEEIEHILSLANEKELEDFLRGRSFDFQTDAIAQAAFGALARHSPERAAGYWLAERFFESYAAKSSCRALMREWVKRDPATAGRWIEEQADEEGIRTLRSTYHLVLAGTNPAMALALIPEVELRVGSDFVSVLKENLDLSQFPAAVEQFLAEREDGSGAKRMAGRLLYDWGKRDPEAMMAWLMAQDLEALGDGVLRSALTSQAGKDPGEFLDRFEPAFSGHPVLREVTADSWLRWTKSEDHQAEAVQWLFSREDAAELLGALRESDVYNIGIWKPDQAKRALEALAEAPDAPGKDKFVRQLLFSFRDVDPQLVIAHAREHLPPGDSADNLIAHAVANWAKEEPETAVRWALENLESDSAKSEAVSYAFGSWAEDDAPAALAALMELPEKMRDSAAPFLTHDWCQRDPAGLDDYLQSLSVSDPDAAAALMQHGYRQLAEFRYSDRYLDHALAMPPGKLRRLAVRGFFGGWAISDSEAGADAVDRIPEGSLRDAAIESFIEQANTRAPETAFNLATRIEAAELKREALISAGQSWMKQNPDQARASIQSDSALPAEVKAEILKGSQ